MLAQLNDCIGGLLHLGPNVITFRTLLHLGQLLHLGLQQMLRSRRLGRNAISEHFRHFCFFVFSKLPDENRKLSKLCIDS